MQQLLLDRRRSSPDLDQPYPTGFRSLAPVDDIEGDALTFIEGREPGWCESRDVNEYVLATTIPSDEAEAPLDIESFHRAGFLAGERGGGRLIGQAMACMVGSIATAAMTIMTYPVIVTPV